MKTLFSVVSLLLISSACSSSNDTNIAQSNPNETGGDQGDSGGGPAGGKTGSGGDGGARVTAGGAGGTSRVGAGGAGGLSRGGAGGLSACCWDGCDGRCVPASTRTCATIPEHPGYWEQDCRCDGTGWQHVRSPTNTGGTCPVLDAGPYVDAAGTGGAPADASRADAGQYCVFESPGAGGAPPSTHCLPLPPGCASCACVTLPYSFCTCTDTGGVVSVRCLGV